jgi:hypothetical protein
MGNVLRNEPPYKPDETISSTQVSLLSNEGCRALLEKLLHRHLVRDVRNIVFDYAMWDVWIELHLAEWCPNSQNFWQRVWPDTKRTLETMSQNKFISVTCQIIDHKFSQTLAVPWINMRDSGGYFYVNANYYDIDRIFRRYLQESYVNSRYLCFSRNSFHQPYRLLYRS